MQPWAQGHHVLLVGVLLLVAVGRASGFFGLTSPDPVRALSPDFEDQVLEMQRRGKVTSADLCNMLSLHRKQRRLCKRGRGVAETLVRATRLAALECQHQFVGERWNCTLGRYRTSMLEKSIKETSFMYAVSSAGLVHEFARACAQGIMDRCTCDESKHLENTKTWLWGGCGDNIRFGLRFTRRFLKRSRRAQKDIRARVDEHNSAAGIKAVRDLVKTTCKCHGVSGSCTVRTCWLQLSPFQKVGSVLKFRYERADKVITFPNQATGNVRLMKKQRRGRRKGNRLPAYLNRASPRHQNYQSQENRYNRPGSYQRTAADAIPNPRQLAKLYRHFQMQQKNNRMRNRRVRRQRNRKKNQQKQTQKILSRRAHKGGQNKPKRKQKGRKHRKLRLRRLRPNYRMLKPTQAIFSPFASPSSPPVPSFPDSFSYFAAAYGNAAQSAQFHQSAQPVSYREAAQSRFYRPPPKSVPRDTPNDQNDVYQVNAAPRKEDGFKKESYSRKRTSSREEEEEDDEDTRFELSKSDGKLVPLRRIDLTYTDDSPNFCRRGRYAPGTSGRTCTKGENCDSLCCGRGYNVQRRTVVKACRCEVIWCCEVVCKECLMEEEIYLCK